jgi:(p)ppGpp synthase/HD superfamily hydrolase
MHLWEADIVAAKAHEGQTDKNGVPYIEHVRAVAAGLSLFAVPIQVAGVLHDVVEDTDETLESLASVGVSSYSLGIIDAVTKVPGSTKREQIERVIAGGYPAMLVKTSDNAHNSLPDRLKHLDEPTRARLEAKYREARLMMWPHLHGGDIQAILEIVNPSLLPELKALKPEWAGGVQWTAG